ncbi:MAG: TIGR04348 family glycosyltransferase [Gammaproteobacteria bacterium]|nr:TIGR04348 family glycosyltransferase [Gammaproteobacteria bacterium]
MHIVLITPAPPSSRAGNRTTAVRWRDVLVSLGHRVDVSTAYEGQNADLMIALHAWRSADAIASFAERCPESPLIVAITGTDAYRFIHSHPESTLRSIRLADRLVGLHDLIALTLPEDQRHKMHVIYQSARPVGDRHPYRRYFHVSVIGHLREEKDPLRPAMAARLLPHASRIQVHQYGKAHTPDWAERAQHEMQSNPRYRWHDEVPRHAIRQVYRRTNLVVLPSRMEGGANVVSEAAVAGAPVVASDIPGSVGLLGENYPGYYPVCDEYALAEVLDRAERDPVFYDMLAAHCRALRPKFTESAERAAWEQLLDDVTGA